ncbi:phage tail protein [Methylobacter sp. S3L5C]|uniref:phage tail-collar fiber domain-containing protein n=1 Tax=Methylobacter sp. S3L5C TaxID=2839024 RepID=UPI001FABFEBD|nr:phage tail protein [Methylobacter sp. S3L5C]UOA08617.1 phage tail protein [Methylobacter sp. S3L5C]
MAFITIAGEQLIAFKQGNNQVLNITHFVLANISGLGAEPASRIASMPFAENIVDIQPVTHQGYVNSNQVVYSLALDSTIGDYDFNWIGLKAVGGELVACTHIPAQQKRKTVGSVPGNNLTRNFLVVFSGIAATTAITVPVNTWQIDFTTRLLQIDDRERLSNFDIYGQSAFFGNGFKVSQQSGSTYAIAAGIGYVGGIRCDKAALSTINVTGLPKSIWIDASLQGDINGVSPVFSFTATASTLADYTDASGFRHYLAKITDINAGGVVSDLRISNKIWAEKGVNNDITSLTALGTAVLDIGAGQIHKAINGNLGIGVPSPFEKLHIPQGSRFRFGIDYYATLGFKTNSNDFEIISNGDQEYRAQIGTNDGTGKIIFKTAGATFGSTEHMQISPFGNIGMGTTSPSAKLHVVNDLTTNYGLISQAPYAGLSAGSSVNMAYFSNPRNNGKADGIRFVNRRVTTAANTNDGWMAETFSMERNVDGVGIQGGITFGNNTLTLTTGNTDRVYISQAGNVGIGTSNADAKLTVNGAIQVKSGAIDSDITVMGYSFIGDADSGLFSSQDGFISLASNGVRVLNVNSGMVGIR